MAKEKSLVQQFLERINNEKTLPRSAIEKYSMSRTGLYSVKPNDYIKLPDKVGGESKLYGYEKCVPNRRALKNTSIPGVYNPMYFRPFEGSMFTAFEKMVANHALQLYPTPLSSYGYVDEASFITVGSATNDLEYLFNPVTKKLVESKRLDYALHDLGCHYEINSFKDYQSLLQNPAIVKNFSAKCLMQLGVDIVIALAVGETDPNSRNHILLKNEKGKWDMVVRIDAEANTFINDMDNSRSGNKVVPKGIYTANETQDEFLKNISDKGKDIDWNLFKDLILAGKEMLRRTNVDNKLTSAYFMNSGKVDQNQFFRENKYLTRYNELACTEFPERVLERANRFFDNIQNALDASTTFVPPFMEKDSRYPGLIFPQEPQIEIPFVQQCLDDKNNDVTLDVLNDIIRISARAEVPTFNENGSGGNLGGAGNASQDVEQ